MHSEHTVENGGKAEIHDGIPAVPAASHQGGTSAGAAKGNVDCADIRGGTSADVSGRVSHVQGGTSANVVKSGSHTHVQVGTYAVVVWKPAAAIAIVPLYIHGGTSEDAKGVGVRIVLQARTGACIDFVRRITQIVAPA